MLDLTIHYNEETRQLYIEPEHHEGEIFHNVERKDIPEKVKEFLTNLLTNNIDVL